jgi:hypothetical protein
LRVSEEGGRRGILVVNVCSACQGSMGYLSYSLLGFCCGSFKSVLGFPLSVSLPQSHPGSLFQ